MAIRFNGIIQREALSDEECRDRLRQARWARLLISVRCLPASRPVPLVVDGETLLVATDEEVVWEAAERHEVLTLNIDGVEPSGATWTVTTTGVGWVVNPTEPSAALPFDHPLLPYLDNGARLIALPLTLVVGDQTVWSFPRAPR
ncbi:unannotated protein [freshwater metagenome]|uniref:Unannotated protein n=1 Tax=freshwater metagenome TaxID=449393 RepID=A0A6J7E053_9ZZZZ|nr:pyridoxamine 5'-phosphate oxidase family protein [Actinomycetota bacterium]MUH58589.1 hypothetical protein [Actinomycetota bacterium]